MTRVVVPDQGRRVLAATLAVLAALFVLAVVRYAPPPPRDAPPAEFSANRAREVQRVLAEAPRPAGTEANGSARSHVKELLQSYGLEVEDQHGFACGKWGSCAWVTNTIAHIRGTEPEADAILLVAHIDSVPVSYGANDDGIGTATMVEVARAITQGAKPKRNVVVLVTDAEEDGLLGAELFANDAERTKGIKVAINVDSRGSTGTSAMFEATPNNAWLVALMAEYLPRPVTTSVFYEVYKRMPNDTDFTAMKRFAEGVNFANVARIEHYHTPLDAMENSDPGTLQHHGDHVLAMVRAFDDANLSAPHHGDAVWFDVMAVGIVRWPERASLPFAIVAFVLVFAHVIRGRLWGRALASFPTMFFSSLAAGGLLNFAMLRLGALPAPWVAHPLFAHVAIQGLAIAMGLRVHALVRGTPGAAWAGTWLSWAAIGIASAAVVPGVSYIFIVPAFVAGIAGWSPVRATIPATIAAVVIFPLVVQMGDALGFAAPVLPVLFPSLIAGALAPLLFAVPKQAPRAIAVLAVMGTIATFVLPSFSASSPQRVNVLFRQDDAHARVHVDNSWGWRRWGTPPASMIRALGAAQSCDAVSFGGLSTKCAEVARVDLPPPELVWIAAARQNGGVHYKALVRSPRGAPRILLELPKDRVFDIRALGQTGRPYGNFLDFRAVPEDGVEFEFDVRGEEPFTITIHDRSFGVVMGSAAEAVVAARPKEATSFQEGDVTILSKSFPNMHY